MWPISLLAFQIFYFANIFCIIGTILVVNIFSEFVNIIANFSGLYLFAINYENAGENIILASI